MPSGDCSTFPPKLSFFNGPIVHLIRHSMNFCSWKDRKTVAADLRPIYEAPTSEEAARQLDSFEE